jgi:hypothetical protein
MYLFCGECGRHHELRFDFSRKHFFYYCEQKRYDLPNSTPVHEYAPKKLLLIKPRSPVLN